ncbi:MAG TPA: GNAT family N-acetyltransferase [Burkholderiales bacterium]
MLGSPITLRPLRPEDYEIEHAFVSALSSETRHSRLLGGARAITREYIEELTRVDYRRDMALAAVLMIGAKETLIGVARYVREKEGDAAEFAIVIADAWQARGIGRRMMEKLIDVARQLGVGTMYGDVLSINVHMLTLLRRLGFTFSRHPEDATVTRATLPLRKDQAARN